jgi:hypothetical protein
MATINFLFRSSKEKANLNVRLLFRHNNKDYVLGAKTKLEVTKLYWNKQHKLKRIKNIELANFQRDLLTNMHEIERFVFNEFENFNKNEIEKKWLQLQIDNFYNPKDDVGNGIQKILFDFLDNYLKVGGKKLNPHTKQSFI